MNLMHIIRTTDLQKIHVDCLQLCEYAQELPHLWLYSAFVIADKIMLVW
jgi:hypothetical protein